jgi:integrase
MARRRRGKGEGTITQRPDGRWMGQITVGYDPVSGKQVRETVYGKTYKEVQDKLLDLRNKARTGALGQSDMPLKVYLEFWLGAMKLKVSPSSYERYSQSAAEHLVPLLGTVHLDKLSAFHVMNLYRALEANGKTPGAQYYAGKVLRMALEQAVRLGMIRTNPATKVPLPRAPDPKVTPPDEPEAWEFLRGMQGRRLYALCVLALDSGLRWGELCALTEDDINLQSGVVSVTKSLKWRKGKGPVIEPAKTARSMRRVKIAQVTVRVLQEYMQSNLFTIRAGGPVFSNLNGGYWTKGSFYRLWNRERALAGFPDLRFHDLRHTSATLLLARGVNARVVSERLGHGSVAFTLGTYAHVLPSMESQVVRIMDEMLSAAVDQQYNGKGGQNTTAPGRPEELDLSELVARTG